MTARDDWSEWAAPGADFDIDGNVWPGSRLDAYLADREALREQVARALHKHESGGEWDHGRVGQLCPACAARADAVLAVLPSRATDERPLAQRLSESTGISYANAERMLRESVTPTEEQIAKTIDAQLDMPLSSRLVLARAVLALSGQQPHPFIDRRRTEMSVRDEIVQTVEEELELGGDAASVVRALEEQGHLRGSEDR